MGVSVLEIKRQIRAGNGRRIPEAGVEKRQGDGQGRCPEYGRPDGRGLESRRRILARFPSPDEHPREDRRRRYPDIKGRHLQDRPARKRRDPVFKIDDGIAQGRGETSINETRFRHHEMMLVVEEVRIRKAGNGPQEAEDDDSRNDRPVRSPSHRREGDSHEHGQDPENGQNKPPGRAISSPNLGERDEHPVGDEQGGEEDKSFPARFEKEDRSGEREKERRGVREYAVSLVEQESESVPENAEGSGMKRARQSLIGSRLGSRVGQERGEPRIEVPEEPGI